MKVLYLTVTISVVSFFFFSSSYMLSNVMANYGMKKTNVCFVVIIASA